MTERPLRLAATCPSCGRHPAIRTYASEVEEKKQRPPEEKVLNYQCRWCNFRFDITVRAFREAS